jgi:hypothetical protein
MLIPVDFLLQQNSGGIVGAVIGDIATSVEVEHAVQEIGQSWYKAVESIIETATLLHKYKKSKLWKPIKEELIARNIMKDSVMSMLSAIAENTLLTSQEHIPLLPPSYNTLYQLTKLGDEELERRFIEGDIHPNLKVEDTREWRKELAAGIKTDRSDVQLVNYANIKIPADAELFDDELENALKSLQERFPFLVINFVTTKS